MDKPRFARPIVTPVHPTETDPRFLDECSLYLYHILSIVSAGIEIHKEDPIVGSSRQGNMWRIGRFSTAGALNAGKPALTANPRETTKMSRRVRKSMPKGRGVIDCLMLLLLDTGCGAGSGVGSSMPGLSVSNAAARQGRDGDAPD